MAIDKRRDVFLNHCSIKLFVICQFDYVHFCCFTYTYLFCKSGGTRIFNF